ncbi:DUF982 domain-containing protein [Aurantimonas sp. A2-1-M11]|uniref:DUF982 domain-containing protein n=1 Tax=Aurantimonas sp. A2-1-M11 TaxID=3113712 RepID=UPI002F92E4F7
MIVEVFGAPVFVKSGKRLVQEICSISDVVDFLDEWTGTRCDMRAEALLRACFDVQAGNKPASVVRENFIKFAKYVGIWEDPETMMPWIQSAHQGGGRVQA